MQHIIIISVSKNPDLGKLAKYVTLIVTAWFFVHAANQWLVITDME